MERPSVLLHWHRQSPKCACVMSRWVMAGSKILIDTETLGTIFKQCQPNAGCACLNIFADLNERRLSNHVKSPDTHYHTVVFIQNEATDWKLFQSIMFFTLSYPLKRFFLPVYPHKKCRLSSAVPVAVGVNLSDSATPVTADQMRPVHHPIPNQMSRFFHEAPTIEQRQR